MAQDVKVYICDTNNHCIRTCYYDLGQVTTCVFKGVPSANSSAIGTKQDSIRKREAVKGATDQTNFRCEGDECFQDAHFN